MCMVFLSGPYGHGQYNWTKHVHLHSEGAISSFSLHCLSLECPFLLLLMISACLHHVLALAMFFVDITSFCVN